MANSITSMGNSEFTRKNKVNSMENHSKPKNKKIPKKSEPLVKSDQCPGYNGSCLHVCSSLEQPNRAQVLCHHWSSQPSFPHGHPITCNPHAPHVPIIVFSSGLRHSLPLATRQGDSTKSKPFVGLPAVHRLDDDVSNGGS